MTTVLDIKERTAAYFNVPIIEMTSSRRASRVARPRQVAMYLSRELTERSLPEIGRCFKRDHTTVMHAVRRIVGLMETDVTFHDLVSILRSQLEEPAVAI